MNASTRRFVRHYIEMVVVMVIGMFALGPPANAIIHTSRRPALMLAEMAVTMTLPMVAWRRARHANRPADGHRARGDAGQHADRNAAPPRGVRRPSSPATRAGGDMTAHGADPTAGTRRNLWRSRSDQDANVMPKETTRWSWIRRAWRYIVDRPLV